LEREIAAGRFHEVLWPYLGAVLRVAQILTKNATDAEDLTQDVMLKAYRAIDQFQEGTDAKAWLLAILRNARVDRLRSAGASADNVSLEGIDLDPPGQERPSALDWQVLAENPELVLNEFSDQQMIEALGRLPEEIRWTLLLVTIEGMDQPEAAQVLDVPVGTVKSRLHRGRAMLREALLPLARERRMVQD